MGVRYESRGFYLNKRVLKLVAAVIILIAVSGVMCLKFQSISKNIDLKTNVEIMAKIERKNNEKVVSDYKKTIELNLNKFFIITIKRLLK